MTDVLHALRCMGFTGPGRIAAATGLDESTVESELIDLAVAGLVTRTTGVFGGWGLTEAGRAEDARRAGAALADDAVRAVITKGYNDFLVLNPELLDLCTAWQTGADRRVVLRLFTDFHARADSVLAALPPQFGRYRTRLATALDRVRAGDERFVADDLEAYHTVWFQLHEDLLTTLGIPR
ncbi:transcriptional regulator [Actinophytocola oryzae]|uniref:Uncharacterized protein n=1 Tax=Actinophytocola oryzae TaxID=502181 RepID=A0A4R7VAZ9_9PSEU|nr:transcriptional regulator [Actinophytocola oryzae]TDV46138.1 hypothetical protein CLV71_11196 [Actinophytocola oryzae]